MTEAALQQDQRAATEAVLREGEKQRERLRASFYVSLLKAGKSILTVTYVNYEWTVEHVLVVHVLMSSALALLPEAAFTAGGLWK